MQFIMLFAGIVLLFMGRKFFWLFVALVGFLAGFTAAGNLFHLYNPLLVLFMGVAFGLVGALLAMFLQHIAVLVFGFVAGWYCTESLMLMFGLGNLHHLWLPALIGGLVAMVLLATVFDYALVLLSAVIGAYAIVNTGLVPSHYSFVIFLILIILGVTVQFKDMQGKPKRYTVKRRKEH